MPVVTVQESSGRSQQQHASAIEGITDALARAYGIAPAAVTVFFQEYDEASWGKAGRLRSME